LLTLTSNKIGQNAEDIAKKYLMKQGLVYIESNYHSRFGEIDLIFNDKKDIVFIEVRYRKNNKYGHSFETIDKKKQNKIIKTAEYYLHKHQLTESVNCRFDVIGIEPKNTKETSSRTQHSINWIKNAFCCF